MEKKICGLMGDPVGHSLSPVIHENFARHLGIDMEYKLFHILKGTLHDELPGLYSDGISGLNATVPHKIDVMPELVEIDDLAKAIGAVNTLVRQDNGYKGYNTDIYGLSMEVEEAGVDLKDRFCIILGAGGAARTAAFLCASKGAAKAYILNRTVSKACDIAKDVNEYVGRECLLAMDISDYGSLPEIEEGYVCFQSTKVGLSPNVDEAVIEDMEFYRKVNVGFDLVYNPPETRFMQLVKEAGGTAFNGMKMLIYQAAGAFQMWFDVKIPAEVIEDTKKLLS